MDSIIQKDKTRCFLCGMNTNLEPLDCHHVYFGPYRKKSEKYGLKVFLHHNRCHIFGARSVHQCASTDRAIKRVVQKRAMEHYGWTTEQFIELFGKNYIY